MPVVADADAAQVQAQLEAQRQALRRQAQEMDEVRRDFDMSLHEYNLVHGFTL